MKQLGFTSGQLIDSINFTEDDYNKEVENGNANASFKEFIKGIMDACGECGGTLEDAIFQAEDAFEKISKGTGDGNSKKITEKSTFSLFKAKEAAEDYITSVFEGTSTAYAVKQVAVDPSYRCLAISNTEMLDFIEQQCVCIFTVKYHKGNSTVISVDYVSDKCLSK